MMNRKDELAAVKAQCLMQVQQLWSRMDGRERSHFLKTLMSLLLRRRHLPESRQQKLAAQRNTGETGLTSDQQELILRAASATGRLSASGGNTQP